MERKLWGNIKATDNGCWEWQGPRDTAGYGAYSTNSHTFRVHRLFYRLFYGEYDELLVICHKCDNPPCVNPDHLFIGTQADNIRDAVAKGRFTGRPSARRDHEDYVIDILAKLLAKYKTQSELARQLGLTRQAVSLWFRGKAFPTVTAKRKLGVLMMRR